MIGSRERAFTLVEVLASVLILGGTMAAVLLYGADALALSLETERRTRAVLLAESEMEGVAAALRESFATDLANWPNNLGDGYCAIRTVTSVSQTLKCVEVSVGYDVNEDSVLGTDEIMVTLMTQNVKRN